jgi:hypothetical protein
MWKNLYGFENLYIINELGVIKSLPRKGTSGGVIKQYKDKSGYFTVGLCKDGKKYNKLVSRLVYYSFYPNADISLQINHKDENTENNHLSNLEAISQYDNLNYGTRNKRISLANSNKAGNFQKNVSKKINCYIYPSMEYVKTFRSTKEVERELKVCHSHVSKCCKGIYKQSKGYTFRYA